MLICELATAAPVRFNCQIKGRAPTHKKAGSIRDIQRKIEALRGLAPVGLADLMGMWRSRDLEKWSSCSETYELLGERVLEKGEPLLAYDIVNEGVTNCPMNVRLRQLQGLALARSGATERASRILEQLRAENHIDEETLGMLGRTYKDHAARAVTPRDAREFLRRAAETYTQAYKINAGYWAGINAATSFLLLGNKKDAARLAKKVKASCLRELKRLGRDDYWLLATLGEAALILRDWSQARDWYAQAGTAGLRRFGDLQSSRCNARLILNYWKVDPSEIERCLQIPRVAVFSGHIIDRPGRAKHRFPTELEPAVAEAIGKKIQTVGAGIGYSSAACGSDILFLEAMLDLGGEIVLVLPYEREQFSEDSVNAIQSSRWRSRFERVLGRATRVITASKQHRGIGGVSYDYANQILLGLASIHARRLETELAALAVWDGLPGDGGGGTASAIERWLKIGLPVEIIDPTLLTKGITSRARKSRIQKGSGSNSQRTKAGSNEFRWRIMSMLFADAVAFTKLSEDEVPLFVRHFLGSIGRLIAKSSGSIFCKNTWGDGVHLVFSTVEAAGKFALEVRDVITGTCWEECGLPRGLNVRIALHAGPVYQCRDPITGKRSYSGTHVSYAARIEPITPPGQVYASEAFAALAAIEQNTCFDFDYAGQIPMAKGYGVFPMYHMRRMAPKMAGKTTQVLNRGPRKLSAYTKAPTEQSPKPPAA